MAQQSGFWDSTGTGDGSASGYTETQHYQYHESLFLRDKTTQGVLKNFLNGLAVSGTATPVSIATGAAVVAGFWYINDASTTLAVSTPAVSTRIDRVILRVSWSAQTVRLVLLAGSEGGAAPTLTQSLNTTWEISLAQVSITTGGAITVTDERSYAKFNTEVDTNSLADDAVTFAKMQNITTDRLLGRDTASSGNVEELTVGGGLEFTGSAGIQIADLGVTTGKIDDLGVTGAKIANQTIDPATKLQGTNGVIADPANGNARGTDAIDLQTNRAVAAQVASGSGSVVGGGTSNTASGSNASVGGGSSNTASGNFSSIPGGSTNEATGIYAIALGNSATARLRGQLALSSGKFGGTGDAQTSFLTLLGSTSDGTQTEIFLDGSSVRVTLESDTTWAFRLLIVGRRTDADNESAAYEFLGCIDNNAGTVALVGSLTKTVIAEDSAAWDATVEADDTNNALVIKVTGEAAKTIRWVASIWAVEVEG